MADAHSPENQPGIGRIDIPVPPHLFGEPEAEGVLMHDDLEELVIDCEAGYNSLTALITLLRTSSGDAQAHALGMRDRQGLAELLDGVRGRLELAVEGARMVHRTVLGWGVGSKGGAV